MTGFPEQVRRDGYVAYDIHVKPNEHDQWSVVAAADLRSQSVESTWETQKEAEARARSFLQELGGGSLTLYSKDGKPKKPVSVG